MSNLDISIDEIKILMESFQQKGLGSFVLSKGDFSLKFDSEATAQSAHHYYQNTPTQSTANVAVACAETSNTGHSESIAVAGNIQIEQADIGTEIKAPIVGTFYSSPSPDKDSFVKCGDTVNEGDVLFIIESMKLMNEITAEMSGIVTKILIQDGQPVEYGQPILLIKGN